MKLSHLSLAILSAIALAACGGSGSDDHTTDPNGDGAGTIDQTTPKNDDGDKKEDTAKEDAKIVDPTGDQVVDSISLAETPTTASQQYLRGKESQFDRIANPNQPASATVLSGISLDKQNPQLTNIVIGRIDDKNSKGERVQVAFYAGSDSSQMNSLHPGSIDDTLQYQNMHNALVGGFKEGDKSSDANSVFGLQNSANESYIVGAFQTLAANPILGNAIDKNDANSLNSVGKYAKSYDELQSLYRYYKDVEEKYNDTLEAAKSSQDFSSAFNNISVTNLQGQTEQVNIANYYKKIAGYLNTKITEYNNALSQVQQYFNSLGIKEKKHEIKYIDQASVVSGNSASVIKLVSTKHEISVPNNRDLEKYGAGLYWYTYDNAQISGSKSGAGWGDKVEAKKGVVGVAANATTEAARPTTGLVGIYKDSDNKLVVRGSEDNNVRTTRIFGHYYLDPGSKDGLTLNQEGFNSWSGARTFITGLDSKDNANQYGLGVAPITLNHVQYGRVTATIDGNNADEYNGGTSGWVKKHQNFAARDPKYADDADDFYFYRGTNATSIEDMAKLPTDANITYQGHALMYGIDNKFHGGGQELPNAFGNQQSYGVGNFVAANLNMGSKKFDGYVYNVWGTPNSADVKVDKLVEFSGDVTGNTVIGTANLAYDTSKTGDLRASFYGANAEEVGGAINSVKRDDPYGPIGWGGVFGAQRTSTSGNSAWLVSSEKK